MDKQTKALRKIPKKQRKLLLEKFEKAISGKEVRIDLKQIKGKPNTYRLRSGDYRLIYKKLSENNFIVLHVGKRNENTYRDF